MPVLHPDPEPVDGLALATKAIEAVGLLAATSLLWRTVAVTLPPRPKGTLDMNTTRASRPIPLALTALVALLRRLAALAVAERPRRPRPRQPAHDGDAHPRSRSELALRRDMRQLWEDHIVWTRLAIISLTTGSPDTEATVGRLLRNQTDIGNAVKPFYGEAAGNELTRQLAAHPDRGGRDRRRQGGRPGAARRRPGALANERRRHRRRARNSVNPRYWKLGAMKAEMRMHLKLTTEEAVASLQGNWTADVAAYDKIHRHALHVADTAVDGLVKQFPKRFR